MNDPTKTQDETSAAYGAEAIRVLEGLEAVRVRPAMYIGSTSESGLHHLVYEVVEKCDGNAPGFLAKDVAGREGQGQEQTASLTGGGGHRGIDAVDEKVDGIAMRAHEAAPQTAFVAGALQELVSQDILCRGLAGGSRVGSCRDVVGLSGDAIAVAECGAKTPNILRAALTEFATHDHEPLVPGVEGRAAGFQGSVSLPDDLLVVAGELPVRREEGPGAPVDEQTAFAHRATHDPEALGRIDHDVHATLVRPRRDLPLVHEEPAAIGGDLYLEGGLPAAVQGPTFRPEAPGAPPYEGAGLIGSEGTPSREQADRLQEGRLPLCVAPDEDIQTWVQIQLSLADVSQITHLQPS